MKPPRRRLLAEPAVLRLREPESISQAAEQLLVPEAVQDRLRVGGVAAQLGQLLAQLGARPRLVQHQAVELPRIGLPGNGKRFAKTHALRHPLIELGDFAVIAGE